MALARKADSSFSDFSDFFPDWTDEIQKNGFARFGNKIVFSNLFDSHVHFRVPGGEHKEDWKTGSAAAAAGGITGVLEMPNTNPPAVNQSVLDLKIKTASRDSCVNFGFFLGATSDNTRELNSAAPIAGFKVYVGSSTGNLLVSKSNQIETVFRIAKKRNLVACVHAEDEETIQQNMVHAKRGGWNHARFHSKIRTTEAEAKAIKTCISLQEKIGNRLHVCHLSSAAGLELIRESKETGNALLSCEVSPSHLFLSEDDSEKLGNRLKMNPAIKSKSDQSALWKGLRERTIDVIATDHAPHTLKEKNKPFFDAPSGLPGVETLVPLLLDAVHAEKLSFLDMARLCSQDPHRIFGLAPKPNCFSIVDPAQKWVVQSAQLHSKCGWSPFEGWELRGRVEETIVNNKTVFQNQKVIESAGGVGKCF